MNEKYDEETDLCAQLIFVKNATVSLQAHSSFSDNSRHYLEVCGLFFTCQYTQKANKVKTIQLANVYTSQSPGILSELFLLLLLLSLLFLFTPRPFFGTRLLWNCLLFFTQVRFVAYLIVIFCIDITWHSKIPDLHYQTISDQTVSCSQVPVEELHLSHILHASGDLGCYRDEVFLRELNWPEKKTMKALLLGFLWSRMSARVSKSCLKRRHYLSVFKAMFRKQHHANPFFFNLNCHSRA